MFENVGHARPTNREESGSGRTRLLTKKLTLLNRLVRTSTFQFLAGNLHWREIGRSREVEHGKKYVQVQQSVFEQGLDLLMFALLVFAAPFYAFNKILRTYWSRFCFGVVCGLAVVYVAYRMALYVWNTLFAAGI